MAPYNTNNNNNQYGSYNDPVGSQAGQPPSGSTYQNATSSSAQYPSAATASAYNSSTNYQSYGGNTYGTQQYGSQQKTGSAGNTNTNRVAAAALSSLSATEFNQPSTKRSSSTQQYDNAGWANPNYSSNTYGGTNLQVPDRAADNSSTQQSSGNTRSSSFGQGTASVYGQQTGTQSAAPTYAQQSGTQGYQGTSATTSATPSYQSSYITAAQSQAQSQPQRYASPLYAIRQQQQQGHNKQSSRGSNHQSPQRNTHAQSQVNNRQQSASVEPVSTTVDPSHVYDFRAEREKKAKIEAEKRRKFEEAEAVRKAEEERVAAEARKVEEHIAAGARKVEEAKKAKEDAQRKVEEEAAAVKRAELDKKNEQRRKAREDKRQSKTAATALTQMASSGADHDGHEGPPATPEEAEMRLMFKKMREFNARNPAMLAKLWEEERQSHASKSPQPAKPAKPASRPLAAPAAAVASSSSSSAQPPPRSVPAPPPTTVGLGSSTALSASTAAPTQLTSFQVPTKPAATSSRVPAATNQGSSLWPPGKKDVLADIAAKWLLSNNPGRQVTKQELLERLDRNPNYVQLCESLESLGLKFERADFAKQLLHAIPSNNSTKQQSQQPAEAVTMVANGTTAHANGTAAQTPDSAQAKPKRTRATKAEMEQRRALEALGIKPPKLSKADKTAQTATAVNNGTVQYEMPSFSLSSVAREVNDMHRAPGPAPAPAPADAKPSMGGPVQPLAYTSANQPPVDDEPYFAPPMDDDEPSQLEQKRRPTPRPPADKEEAARKRGFGDLVDLTAEDSDDEAPPRKMMNMTKSAAPMGQQPWNGMQRGPPMLGPSTTSRPYTPSQLLQMAIGPNGISNGYPRPPPVPSNMSANVPNASSAAPAPPPMQPKRKGPSQEQLQKDRIRGQMVVEPIMRDRVARRSRYDPRTIARDVLLATGRHPDMRALNGHMDQIQKLLSERGGVFENGGNKSDLSTIRWELIDPTPVKKVNTSKPDTVAVANDLFGEDADDEDDAPEKARAVARQQPVDLGDGTVIHASAVTYPLANKPRIPKKRGRPAKHRAPDTGAFSTGAEQNAMPSMGPPGRQSGITRSSVQPTSTPATAPAARPAAPSSSSVQPTGYAAFRQVDENGNPIKKKGRPVGWRKSIHSREAHGLTPAKQGSRPGGSDNGSALAESKYQVYKCRWDACSAELHSLDTLKKHIVKVHGRTEEHNGLFTCLWADCHDSAGRGGEPEPRHTFEEIDWWLSHVEKQHLQPVAWQLGDGPRGGGLSDHYSSDAYLSDHQGRSVTLIIRPMDSITLDEGAAASAGAAGPGRPPAGAASRDERAAAAELQKLEDRKRVTGFSIEKTGSRLANGKRRMGFLDDEDFEDQVPAEGETESEHDNAEADADGGDDGMEQ